MPRYRHRGREEEEEEERSISGRDIHHGSTKSSRKRTQRLQAKVQRLQAKVRARMHRRISRLSAATTSAGSKQGSEFKPSKNRKRKQKKSKSAEDSKQNLPQDICWIPARIQDFNLVNYWATLLHKRAENTPEMDKQRAELLLHGNKLAAPRATNAIKRYYKYRLPGFKWPKKNTMLMKNSSTDPQMVNPDLQSQYPELTVDSHDVASASATSLPSDMEQQGAPAMAQAMKKSMVNNTTQTDGAITVTLSF